MREIATEQLPYRSRELRVEAGTLRYLDEGPGETGGDAAPLLCVHGNPTWSFYWRRVVERFSPSRRVVAIDHLGCGRSDKPPRDNFPYTMAAHRDHLVRLIDALDLRETILVAHDWGGAIGLSALLRRRERFAGIVLLNTGAFPPPYLPWRIAACRMPLLGTLAVRGLNLFARAAVSMAMSRRRMDRQVAAGLLAPYDSWAHRVAIDCFVRDIPMSPSHPTYRELQSLEDQLPTLASLPTLLVWGMRDWCFRPECLHRFEAVWPDTQVVPIADAGHYVLEDAPEETLSAIERYLLSIRRANGADSSAEVGTKERAASRQVAGERRDD